MPPARPLPTSWAELAWTDRLILLGLAAFAILLSILLWPAWRHNPDVSHGLAMPVIFVLLLYESRSSGTPRYLAAGRGVTAASAGLAFAGVGALFTAGLYAAAVDWSNALVNFLLAGSLALLLGAALVHFAGNRVRLLPFNWISAVAVGLWVLSSPIPPGTYTRLTVELQLWISSGVLHALHLFGVLAYRRGNIIELATTTVGIEEACSGVRSLVSCIFAGFFFSASILRRPRNRAVIILLAAPLAIGMNFIRSLTLTLLANDGVNIAGFWHDATGYAVLVVTALILGGLAIGLERARKSAAIIGGATSVSPSVARASARVLPNEHGLKPMPLFDPADTEVGPPAMRPILAAAISLCAILVAFFYLNTHPGVRRDAPIPNLLGILPEAVPGWRVSTNNTLTQFKDILQTDILAQRTYRRPDGSLQITFYLAYWRPGQAPVSLVATHTPDACWPGSGWVAQPLPEARADLPVAGRDLAEAECRLFTNAGFSQYAWFWHLYDGRPIDYINPHSLGKLLRIAWLYGFRHEGDQLFVLVRSNRPWPEIDGEPLVKQFFADVKPLGL